MAGMCSMFYERFARIFFSAGKAEMEPNVPSLPDRNPVQKKDEERTRNRKGGGRLWKRCAPGFCGALFRCARLPRYGCFRSPDPTVIERFILLPFLRGEKALPCHLLQSLFPVEEQFQGVVPLRRFLVRGQGPGI